MATSLHDGGSRADFNRQQKTSKDSEMTLITYLKQYNPEFLRQAILTLANPSIRPNPEAGISEFISIYRDVQNDDVFRAAVSTYVTPERNSFKQTQKATPKSFPRLKCLAIQLGVLGALDSTFEYLDVDQPGTDEIETGSIALYEHILDLISDEGNEDEARHLLTNIFQQAYDLYLTGNEEAAYTYVSTTLASNFGQPETDEEGEAEEEEFDEEGDAEDDFEEGEEGEDTEADEDTDFNYINELILTAISDIKAVSDEPLGLIGVGGIPVNLDNLDADVLPLYSEDALEAIHEKLSEVREGLYVEDAEPEIEAVSDAELEQVLTEVKPLFSAEDQIKNPTKLGLLNTMVSVTPEINFALNVVVEANPLTFNTDMAEVKGQLGQCERYTDEPINFWNTLKSANSESGYRGFANRAISNVMDYLNAVSKTPIQVIADISKEQVLECVAHSMQSVVNTLVYDFEGVSLIDIAIPLEPEAQVLAALESLDIDSIEDATSEDFDELGIEYIDINDLVYTSVYVAQGDTIVTRIHINIPPLAKVKVRSALTKVSQNLAKLLDNSNVETTLGFAYNSVNVFNNLDTADSVRDMVEQGYTLMTRSEIEDTVLFDDSVLPETLTPVTSELVSGMFPYSSDWLVLAELNGK